MSIHADLRGGGSPVTLAGLSPNASGTIFDAQSPAQDARQRTEWGSVGRVSTHDLASPNYTKNYLKKLPIVGCNYLADVMLWNRQSG